ncbi:hypothetical protein SPD48_11880 [Pseudogracilibacillus sp. SE30717A]|uniref:hypothetical protein n=1 Tax=Pseudogracilibacillus sp. SE30717A TaxID=3098293 RepID=UPI00300E66F9
MRNKLTEKRKEKKRTIISAYFGFMLVLYLGYVIVAEYRLNKSEQWVKLNYLTEEDIQNIQQIGFLNSLLEISFSCLFILGAILLFRSQKNRKSLIQFIIVHFGSFTTIFLLGFIFSLFLASPIGNLTQLLILPASLLAIMVFYAIYLMIKGQLTKRA